MHEIVTLQFGEKANYLGTHFWNTQESYFTYDSSEAPSIVDHDINFRPGIGSDGSDTYTPRALVYDLKDRFGSLKKVNALYDTTEQDDTRGMWDGTQRLQTIAPILPSPYQIALEAGLPTPRLRSNDVRYWSDFNRLFYHPRSLIPLHSQSLTSQLFASDSYSAGVDFHRELDLEVGGLLDRDMRLWVEECDSLQGFQIFSSNDDAWGGFTSTYVEDIREEFGKKAVWVWGLEDGQRSDREKQYTRLANSSHVLSSLSTNTSAYIRLSTVPKPYPSYLNPDPTSTWNTTALLSSVIESATLPTRLRPDTNLPPGVRAGNMALYEDMLSGDTRRNLWMLQATMRPGDNDDDNTNGLSTNPPQTSNGHGAATQDYRIQRSEPQINHTDLDMNTELSTFDIDFTPSLPTPHTALPSLRSQQRTPTPQKFSQLETHRHRKSWSSYTSTQTQTDIQTSNLLRLHNNQPTLHSYHTPLPFPLLTSFPTDLFNFPSSSPTSQLNALQINTALITSSATRSSVLALRDVVVGREGRRMGLVDVESREELYDGLSFIAEGYVGGFEDEEGSGSDEGI